MLKVTQATMTNGSKYCKQHLTVFDLSRVNRKSIKKARVLLSFCHTSENTVYCGFLHVAETVEKTRKPECAGAKISQKNMYLFFILSVLTEKKH